MERDALHMKRTRRASDGAAGAKPYLRNFRSFLILAHLLLYPPSIKKKRYDQTETLTY
jgi:hypothetical protein